MSDQQDIDAFDMAYSDGFHKGKKEERKRILEIIKCLDIMPVMREYVSQEINKDALSTDCDKGGKNDKL